MLRCLVHCDKNLFFFVRGDRPNKAYDKSFNLSFILIIFLLFCFSSSSSVTLPSFDTAFIIIIILIIILIVIILFITFDIGISVAKGQKVNPTLPSATSHLLRRDLPSLSRVMIHITKQQAGNNFSSAQFSRRRPRDLGRIGD
ncbi:unnamed protein product [Gadus morhua 'NCC']